MDLLAQWQTAWVLLTQATLVFHDACFNLQSTLPQYTSTPAQRAYLHQMITSRYPTIKLIQAEMADLPLVVNQMFNLSIPFGAIPDDILARIFDIALITSSTPDRPWYHRHDVLTTISSVSTRWRRVAIQTRSFWSHIYSPEPFSRDLVALWLERSSGAPIHIHVPARLSNDRSYVRQLIPVLRPHATRIASIVASVRQEYNRVVPDVMNLCTTHGERSSVKTLVLFTGENHPERPVTFRSFTGLVNFELGWLNGHQRPTFRQIITVLTSNPSLRTLRLRNMRVQPGTGSTASPIELPALRLLDLVGLDGAGVRWLMSALHPGRCELDFRLELLDWANFERAVAQFLERSNVVALWLHDVPHRTGAPPTSQLPMLPSVRVLGLVSEQASLDIAAGMFAGTDETQVVRFPNLRTLYLRGHGWVSKQGHGHIKQIAKAYSSVTVHLDNCLRSSRLFGEGPKVQLLPSSLYRPIRRVFFMSIPLDQTDIVDVYTRTLVERTTCG
ncbi:hypothetical protein FRC10_004375 [Ceratobasidium sp. 414]|nr:hypothetical protein FRC10_004375 [Ceratobasidium sp. 414]